MTYELPEFQTNSEQLPVQPFPEWTNTFGPQIGVPGQQVVGQRKQS